MILLMHISINSVWTIGCTVSAAFSQTPKAKRRQQRLFWKNCTLQRDKTFLRTMISETKRCSQYMYRRSKKNYTTERLRFLLLFSLISVISKLGSLGKVKGMQKKFLIWGTGYGATNILQWYEKIDCVRKENQIIGYVDNNSWGGEFNGLKIYAPQEIVGVEFDYIFISCLSPSVRDEIRRQIVEELKISEDRIRDILAPYKQKLIDKYCNSNDEKMQEFLRKMKNKIGLDVYYFERSSQETVYHEVFYDKTTDLHYIYFEKKRMYLKRNYAFFIEKNGKKYVADIWGEQDVNSPHLYESDKITVQQNDILVDAGACEGNFSLHNIDKVSKVYLIECSKDWMEALYYTFRPYKDKVIFCNKFLGNCNSESTITLDTLVTGPVNFIKMDIEGAEIDALYGAQRLLKNNEKVCCAICSYHKHGDEEKITSILKEFGFAIEVSEGYMLFYYDPDVLVNPELRKGIVRGKKTRINQD